MKTARQKKKRKPPARIFTLGHSNRPIKEFLGILDAYKLKLLIDVRTIPKSRHNPQFGETRLRKSLEKHGIDFLDATRIFAGSVLRARSAFEGEDRWIAIGLLDGLEIAVIYTLRESTCRIITARRARTNERRRYHENFPG